MRLRVVSSVLALMAASGASADPAALIIGNGSYDEYARVRSGASVVISGPTYTQAGFDLRVLSGGDWAATMDAMRDFTTMVKEADRVAVVLSGRFITDGHESWFLATDAPEPRSAFEAGQGGFPISVMLEFMAEFPGRAVLVLGDDGSDDELLGGLQLGLGPLDIPQGVGVVRGAPRSIEGFVREVLPRAGADLTAAVAARRGVEAEGFMPRGYMLLDPVAAEDEPVVVEVPVIEPDRIVDPEVEENLWRNAQQLDSIPGYSGYIAAFPQGKYVTEARIAIDKIRSEPNREARLAEEELALTRTQRREIQRDLSILDYNTRGIDGIFGPGTRGAIVNWQQQNGFEQTSYLTREQMSRLDGQAERRAAELEAEAERRRQEELRLDRAYWEETGGKGDEVGFRAYLERYPDGQYADVAQRRLTAIEAEKRAQARAEERVLWDATLATNTLAGFEEYLQRYPQGVFREEARAQIVALQEEDDNADQRAAYQREERALGLNRITKQLVERKLAELGLEPGPVDGDITRETRRAIRRYQNARDLPVTGFLNEPTIVRLLADSIGLQ